MGATDYPCFGLSVTIPMGFKDRVVLSLVLLLLSARSAMWSMPVVLTETENENDSANQSYVAKMTLQK